MLPNDNGYRYALVVCDVGGKRETDAEPLRTKDAESVLKAFKIIYKRKLLKFPPLMQNSKVLLKNTLKMQVWQSELGK